MDFNIHRLFLFVVFLSLFSHATFSQTKQLQSFRNLQKSSRPLKWKVQLGNEMFANEQDESNLFIGRGVVDGKYRISPSVNLLFNASLQAKMGRSQSRYHTVQGNTFSVSKAYLQWINRGAKVKLGAINQQFLNMPLLISGRPFPAILAEYHHTTGDLSVKVSGQQAIPVSESLESDRIEKEKSPSLQTFITEAAYRWSPTVNLIATGTLFQFKNLPSKVAFESSLMGNTVPLPQENNSRFAFPFRGSIIHLGVKGKIAPRLDGAIGFKQLENSDAPTGFNRGQTLYAQFDYSVSQGLIGLGGELFFNESDSSPSYYSHRGYGNNREGYKLFAKYDSRPYNLRVKLNFYNSNVIEANLYQSNQQILFLSMETFYESL